MKILFYVEPWIEKSFPHWKTIWLDNVLLPTIKNLISANPDKNLNLFFLIGDSQSHKVNDIRKIGNAKVEIITQKELRDVSPNYLQATIKQHLDSFSESELNKMINICKKYLGSYEPDLIFSFMSQVPFLKKMYPKTVVLHQEVGMISRNPYPTTYFLDPFGTFSNGFLGRFKSELNNLKMNSEKNAFLKEFRTIYISEGIKKNQMFSKDDLDNNNKFKYLILLPLQIDPYFSFNSYVKFEDQFDFICYVMDRIDKNIGVVITTHTDWANHLDPRGLIDYVKRTYPNAIFSDSFRKVPYCSQYLLDLVDGIISVSSTIALQALLFKKPIFVVGENSQLKTISASNKIEDIGDVLTQKDYVNFDAILYHLLTHYYFLNEPYIMDGKWLYNFFSNTIKKNKKGLSFEFYEKIDTDEALLKHYRKLKHNPIKKEQPEQTKPNIYNTLINKIKIYIKKYY